MKNVLFTLTLLVTTALTSLSLNAQENVTPNKKGVTITVTVPVKKNNGMVLGGLYTENTFMSSAPIQGAQTNVENEKAVLIFNNVTPGEYAITLFLDTNNNKIMDFEANGMPKEMYGVSNNPMSYGPPQWSEAKFEVTTQNIEMEIRL